jgi:hypothetical protein
MNLNRINKSLGTTKAKIPVKIPESSSPYKAERGMQLNSYSLSAVQSDASNITPTTSRQQARKELVLNPHVHASSSTYDVCPKSNENYFKKNY